jgi:hypothetical protein
MSTTNLLFVPVVEEFEERPTDLVLYAPVSMPCTMSVTEC